MQPLLDEVISAAADVLRGRSMTVLTGAGISTDSGIPDYRGAGAPVRVPMTIERFKTQDDADRRRYWVGGQLGWKQFNETQPNIAHTTLALWERLGLANGILTQNVDGLHFRAGSRRVIELHGTARRIVCMQCAQVFDRRSLSERIERENPGFGSDVAIELGPDGDVTPASTEGFIVPTCTNCGGILRPDVVFFGEFIPADRFQRAERLLQRSDALLIAGSSLTVNSGVRFVERARKRGIPVVIVNRGATRMDHVATMTIDAGTADVLPALTTQLQAGTLEA